MTQDSPEIRQIVLVGPMGAGKTTIGRQLARDLKFEFCDSDKEIESRTGADIPWIFDVEGEAGFRDRETAVIQELSERDDVVLATGGGAVMRPENRTFLKRKGFVVYLNTSVEQQFQRTHRDKNRPLLQQEDPMQVLRDLYSRRDPLYRQMADMIVDTDKRGMRSIVKSIVRKVQQAQD